MNAPPPPPPHGSNPGERGGLPNGNYDIFIIPPHSAGSGFLYLPSLQPHRNSFLAGAACSLLAVAIWQIVYPVLKEWIATMVASGGMGVIVVMMGVAVAAWAWGKTQAESGGPGEGGAGGASHTHARSHHAADPPPQPTPQPPPQPHPQPESHPQPEPQPQSQPGPEFRPPPKPTWQRANPGPTSAGASANGSTFAGAAKGSWERAREETRKKEEDRRRMEEIRKKREEAEQEKIKQREKDAREREIRERRERLEKLARERAQAAAAAAAASTPPPPPPPTPSPKKPDPPRPPSPSKRHQQPTAKTATEDDAYSFRPYDEPKRTGPKTTTASSVYSESSYAPSQSTSRTTPPPSHRGPYRSKDPDKIVLKAVYSFNNTFMKVPVAQLVSGMGSVTDGLILRITTEGLFIDDDVRSVPQREWDVKAWTLKLVEVWCPHLHLGASCGSDPALRSAAGTFDIFSRKGAAKAPTNEESDGFLDCLMKNCKPAPMWKTGSSSQSRSNMGASQSGQSKELHVLRASIRDQEGKRYVFILPQEEAWKVAVGLQRLRRGTQVRALGVSGLAANETKAILEGMGWN